MFKIVGLGDFYKVLDVVEFDVMVDYSFYFWKVSCSKIYFIFCFGKCNLYLIYGLWVGIGRDG